MEDAYEGALGAGTLKLVLYTKTRDLLWCVFVVSRFCCFRTWIMTANLFTWPRQGRGILLVAWGRGPNMTQ